MEVCDIVTNFILENRNSLYRMAYSYVHSRENAEDVVQNSICKALSKCHTLRKPSAVKSWVYRILINEAIQYCRDYRPEMDFLEVETEDVSYKEDFGHEDERAYWKVMELPDKFKTVIVLRFYEECSIKEISEITETNISTVKYRLYKALGILRKELEDEE